jgi:arabinofuranan 3-O-arabinosyltransferase
MTEVRTPRAARPAAPLPSRVPTIVLGLVSALFTLEVFIQRWGRIIHDTRTDLALDPIRFMANTLHLWEPVADMGRVQNQVVGYLVPMGPFFGIGHLLNIPTWIVQRAWIALALCVAMWGFARLADAFDIGTVPWRVIGAVAYALSPYFLARGATLSAFVIAAALLPWAMIPLVRGSQGGSPRRAACASAIAIFLMGGVNAAVTIAVLIVPALYLLTRKRGPRRARLMRWWVLTTSLVCIWWFGSLVLQGKYGVNFLVFTERSATTTGFTAPFEIVRGTADWLSYLYLWNVTLPAGFALVSTGILVLATGLIGAAGLYGLTRRDLPERTFMVVCFLIGVATVGIGFGGLLGNPAAAQARGLLDGAVAIFRTVYKFQPVVTFPLIFGFVHAGSAISERIRATRWQSGWRTVVLPVAAMAVVLVSVGPVLNGTMPANGSFSSVPGYWAEAKQFVGEQGGRTLEVPGLPIADFTWGMPQDDPFNWDTDTGWATRSIAPLGSPSATRYLDAIERAISRGGDPGLEAALRSGGFSTVTVRNDASSQKYLAPAPPLIAGAMTASGLKLIGSFGGVLAYTDDLNPNHLAIHQIDVYGVAGGEDLTSYSIADSAVVSGGPESPMTLAAAGDGSRGYILASDVGTLSQVPPYWIVTDGNRYRFNNFGLNRNNFSYVLSPTDDSPNPLPLSAGLLPSDRIENQTVASLQGAKSISASSTGSWLLAIPEAAPYRAFDGDPSTAWTSGPTTTSVGEWLQIDLEAPTTASTIDVTLLQDGPWRPAVTALKVSTAAGEIVDQVQSDESTQTIALPPGETDWIRVTFADAAASTTQSAGAGIRELTIPGVSVVRRLVTPSELTDAFSDPSRPLPAYFFDRARTNPHSLLRADEETNINRQFTVPRDGTATLSAQVAATPGPWLQYVINHSDLAARPNTLSIAASSTLRDLPEYAARNLLDADPATIWVSARASAIGDSTNPIAPQSDDADPHVTLSWQGPRSIDSLKVDTASGYSEPLTVLVSNGTETRKGEVGTDGTVTFDTPIVADHLDISFPEVKRVAVLTGDASRDVNPLARPLGLSGIEVPALQGLDPVPLDLKAPLHVSCEDGPVVRVNDQDVHLSIDTTGAALTSLETVPATVCGEPDLHLHAGTNTLDTNVGHGAFTVNAVTLQDSTHPLPTVGPTRTVEKQKWTSSNRTVEIGPGAASYLVINENVNKGWVATLDGKELEPTVLDGWRQGFIVPEGEGGLVELHYKPDGLYHVVLIGGFALAAIPFILFFFPVRRKEEDAPAPEGQWSMPLLWLGGLLAAVLIGGVGAVLLVPLWFLARRRPSWLSLVAFGSYTIAAIWVAFTVQPFRGTWRGAFGWPATTLTVLALMTVIASLLFDPVGPERSPWTRWRRPRGPGAHAADPLPRRPGAVRDPDPA